MDNRKRKRLMIEKWQSELSPADRNAWHSKARNCKVLNRLGERAQLSGFNLYLLEG